MSTSYYLKGKFCNECVINKIRGCEFPLIVYSSNELIFKAYGYDENWDGDDNIRILSWNDWKEIILKDDVDVYDEYCKLQNKTEFIKWVETREQATIRPLDHPEWYYFDKEGYLFSYVLD